jgi:hypothetical protein
MKLRTILVTTAAVVATLTTVHAQYNFLGSATGSWTTYLGANPVPVLNTASPGSITDVAGGGASYGRTTDAGGTFTQTPLFRVGDTWRFQFDGVIGNNTTFRIEFSNPGRTSAFTLGIQNANAAGADFLQVDSLGTPAPTGLFSGNFGGAAGGTQRVFGNVDITIQSGTTALISGLISDSTGPVWSAPATMDLGNTAPTLYAAVNVNSGGAVTGITSLSWTLTPVPEPSTLSLTGLGLASLAFWRKRAGRKA